MKAVRPTNTAPGKVVDAALRKLNVRDVANCGCVSGTPRFVLMDNAIPLIVQGCFWHRHNCRAGRSVPRTRTELWTKIVEANRIRDRRVGRALRATGWCVVVVEEF